MPLSSGYLTREDARRLVSQQGRNIVIPDGYQTITRAFYGLGINSVVIPDTVTSIWYDAFESNNLVSLVIPDSVKYIGNYAFSRNNLSSITISSSVNIKDYAFANNNISTIVLPNNVYNTINRELVFWRNSGIKIYKEDDPAVAPSDIVFSEFDFDVSFGDGWQVGEFSSIDSNLHEFRWHEVHHDSMIF